MDSDGLGRLVATVRCEESDGVEDFGNLVDLFGCCGGTDNDDVDDGNSMDSGQGRLRVRLVRLGFVVVVVVVVDVVGEERGGGGGGRGG